MTTHASSWRIIVFLTTLTTTTLATNTPTDWSTISTLLTDSSLTSQLPTIPTIPQATSLYPPTFTFSNGAPFASYSITDFPTTASFCDSDDGNTTNQFTAARAGPSEVCDPATCVSGLPHHSIQCRAGLNDKAILLKGKLGTYWSKALGTPAWAQFVFPAVPEGSDEFHFRFTLDSRYRPELYGGNACDIGDGEQCVLCTGDVWDYTIQPGVFLLWSAAGRDRFVIDEVLRGLGEAWDDKDMVQTVKVPDELELEVGEFPVVTLMTFSQYSGYGEVPDQSKCSTSYSNSSTHPNKDKAIMLTTTSLLYRTPLPLLTTPELKHPRLYGTDTQWLAEHVTPFFTAPCDNMTHNNVGWFGEKGYWTARGHFDLAARGFKSCEGQSQPVLGLDGWYSLKEYFDEGGSGYPEKDVGGFRAFHLLRRLWACFDSGRGGCEYEEEETEILANAVAKGEMLRFAVTIWSCDGSCGGNGDAAFDLTAAEKVSYFTHFYDVLISRKGNDQLLSVEDTVSISEKLEDQIDLFISAFWTGGWQLWNGNNWTPHLCVAAIEWAIVFWHEHNTKATEVLRIANDIMWLHRNYYTDDGVYVEGVAMYTYMSMEGMMAMASLCRASFGFAPTAIDVGTLKKTAGFIISSMATDGYLIDFGDAHRKRGFGNPMAVVEAVIADVAVNGGTVTGGSTSAVIDSIQARAFAASLYGSSGIYSNPWRVRGHVLQFDEIAGLRDPPKYPSRPLGGPRVDLFSSGGYARILTPLLDEVVNAPCFGGDDDGANEELCIDPTLPSLADNIPYSSISLQARDNKYAHSEVDFSTLIWSAWGTRLLSEFGYGTISTSVQKWDMRRYAYLDNNPAGHNTVVIREAFPSDDDTTMNFSQLNFVPGTISELILEDTNNNDHSPNHCIIMDGSNPYGANRSDGWLDIMKRYVCSFTGGTNLILDILQTKANREPMRLHGSQYGGPDFEETIPAAQHLTLDEYFYTNTAAEIEVVDGVAVEKPFVAGSIKRCSHVDVEVRDGHDGGTTAVDLKPACGIGSYRAADGNGLIAGISVGGQGSFVYDGLVTSVDRWFTPHALKQRRFRFVSDNKVGPEGDIRAFVLASYPVTQSTTNVHLTNCALSLGCGSTTGFDQPIVCSCVQACVSDKVSWIIVFDGALSLMRRVGMCDGSSGSVNLDTDIVSGIQLELGFPNITPVPTGSPTEGPTKNPSRIPTAEPTLAPTISCRKQQVRFSVELQTDEKGEDTTWFLKMKKKNGFRNKLKGTNLASNKLYRREICIKRKKCYKFIIKDAKRDGLCCSHGQGYYKITRNGKVLENSTYNNDKPYEIRKFGCKQ